MSLVSDIEVMKLTTGKILSVSQARVKFDLSLDKNRKYSPLGAYAFYTLDKKQFIGIGKIMPSEDFGHELGYSILPRYWGQGFGKEIATTLTTLATNHSPKISSISAVTHPDNIASQKILVRCGFERVKELSWQNMPALLYERKF